MITIPKFNTWSGGTDPVTGLPVLPRRPSVEDVGCATLMNVAGSVADPQTMPEADGWNQRSWQISALCRMTPAVRVSVEFLLGVPTITELVAMDDNMSLVSGHISVIQALAGVGRTDITWVANALPPSMTLPWGGMQTGGVGVVSATPITNGIRVHTLNEAGAYANRNYTICVG